MNPHHRWCAPTTLAAVLVLGAAQCPPQASEVDAGATDWVKHVETFCEAMTKCSDVWGKIMPSKEACITLYRQLVECPAVDVVVNAANGDRCRQLLPTFDCNDPNDETFAVCFQVVGQDWLVNRPQENQPCEDVCASGTYCEFPDTGGICGVCKPDVAVGGECGTSQVYGGPMCVGEAYCDASHRCALLKDDSAVCAENFECKSGRCQSLQCAPRLVRDAACTPNDKCSFFLSCRDGKCTDSATADPACPGGCGEMTQCVQGTCKPVGICTPGAVGEPCAVVGCVDTAYCNADSICAVFTAIGQPCNSMSSGAECGPDAYCSNSPAVCTAYAVLDASCQVVQCDWHEAYCTSGSSPVCSALKADGADCAADWECLSDDCGTDGKCAPRPICIPD